ncbi:MAG: hydroxymethylbilane synthase, partial [Candidatus Binatia bacterium]
SQLKLTGVVASPDGSRLCRSELSGHVDAAAELGRRLAEELLKQGAAELLGAK